MSKKRILIVGLNQLPHSYLSNMCKYLSDCFDVTIISPDEGIDTIENDLFSIVLLKASVNKYKHILAKKLYTLVRLFRIIDKFRKYAKMRDFDLVYIWDQTWAFAIKLIMGRKYKFVMQMFAQGVSANRVKNYMHDKQVKFNTFFFNHIFMGTERNMMYFRIPSHKVHITGVGVEKRCKANKSFNTMDLVYLGILTNRDVHKTISGFTRFFEEHKNDIQMSYHIIGTGSSEYVALLRQEMADIPKDVPIHYHGRLNDLEVMSVFEKCNIGVAFNKVTSYYKHNTSTKLHEYLLSGMPVIATGNDINKRIINDLNGVIIESSPEGFYHGLEIMYKHLDRYDSSQIALSDHRYSLDYVAYNKIIPAFNQILDKDRS